MRRNLNKLSLKYQCYQNHRKISAFEQKICICHSPNDQQTNSNTFTQQTCICHSQINHPASDNFVHTHSEPIIIWALLHDSLLYHLST